WYRGDTLILETDIECDGGKFRVIDFMPPGTERSDVVRIVEGLAGEVSLEMTLAAVFGYGSSIPWVKHQDDGISIIAGPDSVHLRSSVEVKTSASRVLALFPIKQGETVTFVASWAPSDRRPPDALDARAALAATDTYWREWSGCCTYKGRWREAVLRSLITLK